MSVQPAFARSTGLSVLYIDFDSFFANVEKQLDPSLHGRPVGVAPLPSQYSAMIAACYTAKAFGVTRGTTVAEAKKLCPDLAIRTARHDIYVAIHHKIIAAIEDFIPVVKAWSVDEMECAMPPMTNTEAMRLAEQLRDHLADRIGRYVTPSIGLSNTYMLAKIAAEMDKPRGLVALPPEELPGRLLDVPLTAIPGVASNMLARLRRAGVRNMADLYGLQRKQARAIWRSVEGERIWSQLHGYPVVRPPTTRAMFGHSRNLSGVWKRPDKAGACLRALTMKAARRLRADGFLATRISVGVKLDDGGRQSVERAFLPANDDLSLLRHGDRVYSEVCAQHSRARFRNISVMLHGLQRPEDVTQDLFAPRSPECQSAQMEKLGVAMDGLNQKFGGDIVRFGEKVNVPGGYMGGKIAFGRIPETADFGLTELPELTPNTPSFMDWT